jgi:hypothetical protein
LNVDALSRNLVGFTKEDEDFGSGDGVGRASGNHTSTCKE